MSNLHRHIIGLGGFYISPYELNVNEDEDDE